MTVVKVVGSVGKFMSRYAIEASNIAEVFKAILPALPIERSDKAKVEAAILRFDAVADNITAFLADNPQVGEPIKVKASDVQAAVDKYLKANPKIITDAVRSAVGNGNA